MEVKPKVKSVYKAMLILEQFMLGDTYLGVSQIAQSLSLPKSTVSNIMSVFEMRGFVERDSRSGKYKLGIKALELSNYTYHANDVRRILHPFMQELGQYSMENVLLAAYESCEVVYIGTVHADRALFNGRFLIGVRAPAYCTGIGKAILAHKGTEEIEKVIQKGLKPYTENTIVDPQKFRQEMEQVRQQGFAFDNMEHEFGVKCVGVPVFSHSGEVVAGLSISGPSLRMQDEQIAAYSKRLNRVAEEAKKTLIA